MGGILVLLILTFGTRQVVPQSGHFLCVFTSFVSPILLSRIWKHDCLDCSIRLVFTEELLISGRSTGRRSTESYDPHTEYTLTHWGILLSILGLHFRSCVRIIPNGTIYMFFLLTLKVEKYAAIVSRGLQQPGLYRAVVNRVNFRCIFCAAQTLLIFTKTWYMYYMAELYIFSEVFSKLRGSS